MRKPIYCNKQHEVIVDAYLYMVKDFVREVSSENKYESFAQVLDILTTMVVELEKITIGIG